MLLFHSLPHSDSKHSHGTCFSRNAEMKTHTQKSSISLKSQGSLSIQNLRTLLPRSVALAATAYLALSCAGAADADAKLRLARDITEVSLDDLMTIKVPSVTGASRFEQKETDAPASVTVVTAEDIRRHGWRSLGEALNSVRGLYTIYTRSYTVLGVRGYNRPGDFNGHTLMLLDGVRMNENIYSTSLLGPEAVVDVSLIDHIEVIRGSSSSLYGSNAFFGVINVVTKKPSDYQNGAAAVSWGSFDAGRAELTLARTFESGLRVLLHGSWFESQGSTLYFPKFDAPATNNGVIPDLDSEDTQKFFGKAIYGNFTLTAAYSRRDKQVPLPYTGSPFNDRASREADRQAFVDLRYAKKFGDGWDVQAHSSYNWYWFDSYFSFLDVIPSEPNRAVVNHDIGRGRWVEVEVQVNKTIADKHTITFGADTRRNLQQSQKNFDTSPRFVYQDDDETSYNYGIFAQGDVRLHEKLRLNVGARIDHYSTFGNTTNPRFGLIYQPSSKSTIKLLHGTAFRAPVPYEFDYSGANTRPNPELKPEEISSSEIVFEQQLGKRVRFTVAAYSNRIKGLIEQVIIDPTDGTSQYQNRAKTKAQGIETEIEAQWKNGTRLRASFARQHAEDELTGVTLSNSPRSLAKVLLSFPLFEDRLTAGIEAQYRGKVQSAADNQVDDFWFANLNLTAKDVGFKGLDLSFGVFNIFDERYEYPGIDPDSSETVRQDGRTFMLQANYRF